MVVQREPGELYFHGATIEADSTAWIERMITHTLEPIARIEGLPAGPLVARRRARPRQR